jgi:CO dehydrogenase/acetyl-CoA synthase gamma subunit (corrinoid Fe-S protein)
MDYKVEAGLYAVGNPDHNSPVLVSANYKLTFDVLRKNLVGLDCWLKFG